MDINALKSKLSAMQSAGQKKEKVDYSKVLWKPKSVGKYQIRFIPSILDKKNPFKEVFIHYGIGKFPIYALTNWGEKDPIVEFAKKLRAGDYDKENSALAKKLDPKVRIFAPIIVRGEEEKGVRLWEFGKEIYTQLLGIAADDDYGDFTDINEGRDFTIEAVMADQMGRQGIKCSLRIKPKQTPASPDANIIEKWLIEQPDILSVQRKYSFEDLKGVLENFLNPEATEAEETAVVTEEEETKNYAAPKAKTSKAGQFDDLFKEEESN